MTEGALDVRLTIFVDESRGFRVDGHRNGKQRALSGPHSRLVGIIAHHDELGDASRVVEAIGKAADDMQVSIVVETTGGNDSLATINLVAERLIRFGVMGIVVIGPDYGAVQAPMTVNGPLPVVAINGAPAWSQPDVSVDHVAGGRLAALHLLEYGHRTVWFVAGPEDWRAGQAREAGWRAALAERGIDAPAPLRSLGTAKSGYECGRRLARIPGCTAVLAVNDRVALGVMHALTSHGLRIPQDISLVGYGDAPEAGYFQPPLTSVDQRLGDVGREALTIIMNEFAGNVLPAVRLSVEPRVALRNTVVPPVALDGRPDHLLLAVDRS